MVTLDREACASCTLRVDATTITLPRGELVVGRSRSCFLCIEDPSISRLHLRLHVGDEVIVEDLGGTNGTLVNGEPLRGFRTLAHGDRITLGSRVLLVEFNPPALDAEEDDATPPPQTRRPTMQGVGAIGQVQVSERCSRCNEAVPVQAEACPRCGLRRAKGRPDASTSPDHPAVLSRRRSERHPVKIPVRYVSEALQIDAEAANLSLGGAFVSASKPDSVGSTCVLEFPAGDQTVVVSGFVRHVIHRGVGRSAGMGIEFCAPDAETLGWLADQIQRAAQS